MADQKLSELVRADQIRAADLFFLEQSGAARSLLGQTLLNWLTAAADGHGGIQSITPVGKSGLVTTYRITLADLTTVDFAVTDGRGITGITQTAVSGLTRTYTITFNDDTSQAFTVTDGRGIVSAQKIGTEGLVDTWRFEFSDDTHVDIPVTNGAKGDRGDNARTWVKYASQKPTEESHSMGDIPDAWRGEYIGTAATAPTDWRLYTWYKFKGETGETGPAARLTGSSVTYMVSDRGDIVPSGSWQSTVPTVPQGKYLWTRTVLTFNTGSPVTYYSVARSGIDGTGAVNTVNGQNPDSNGNVKLTGEDIPGASGQSLVSELDTKADKTTTVTVTLTVSGWSGGQQTVGADGVELTGDVLVSPVPESMAAYLAAGIWCKSQQTGALIFGCKTTPTAEISVAVKPM